MSFWALSLNEEENDPDILQLLDELNVKWVARWRQETKEAN